MLFRSLFRSTAAGIISGVLLYLLGNLLHVEQVTQCALGACRWFVLPGIGTFQPAELLKFGVLIFTAGFLAYRYKKGLVNNIDKTILPLIGLLAVCSFLVIFLQRDLGTSMSPSEAMSAYAAASDSTYLSDMEPLLKEELVLKPDYRPDLGLYAYVDHITDKVVFRQDSLLVYEIEAFKYKIGRAHV